MGTGKEPGLGGRSVKLTTPLQKCIDFFLWRGLVNVLLYLHHHIIIIITGLMIVYTDIYHDIVKMKHKVEKGKEKS
jgi:hypothetical protein